MSRAEADEIDQIALRVSITTGHGFAMVRRAIDQLLAPSLEETIAAACRFSLPAQPVRKRTRKRTRKRR